MTPDKPLPITKRMVWEAYQLVAGNGQAAGVDGQSLDEFAQDLGNNLYKLWNRMASGSYFPASGKARGDSHPTGSPSACNEYYSRPSTTWLGDVRLAVIVEATKFTGRFSALNGVKALSATRADIIRSLLIVGYPSRKEAVRVVGRWRGGCYSRWPPAIWTKI
ncbi:hypothetical protein ACVWZM_004170 [Bradyrhizobium sp. USDA 4501]